MFEKTMDFSEALKNLKAGKKMTRKGWNGNIVSFDPNMYVWLEPACKLPRLDAMSENLKSAFGRNCSIEKLGTFIMKTRDNKLMAGWLATGADLLAEDWIVVD